MPELGVEIPDNVSYVDLRERAAAACKTMDKLLEYGAEFETPTAEDKQVATALVQAYSEKPEKTSRAVNTNRAASMTPASLIMVKGILDEFGHVVVESSVRIRNLVTNKLLIETENPDARIRLRALELLGKLSDVGLFSEKSEITVTHQSADELKSKLREKLTRLVRQEDLDGAEDAIYAPIDVEAEFGVSYDD